MAKPWVIITGATGFLGGRLVRQLQKEYRIVAIGRRSPYEAGVPEGPDIEWLRIDIGDFDRLREGFTRIRDLGGADLLLHMAAYYDFTGLDHPEYRRTNVDGTRNVLELSEQLKLRRFIFASSIAACSFPEPGESVNEATEPTAPIAYARSKRAGEEIMREFRDRVPSCIVRPAAVFSNWCEYEPLDQFISTWCSHRWNSRVLGGAGQWGIPYLHVRDLLSFFVRVVEKCDVLEPAEVLLASQDGSVTQMELFRAVTSAYFGKGRRPWLVPAWMAARGIRWREWLGRLTGRMPFERSWMAEYIDRRLDVDCSRTRRRIDWAPNRELSVIESVPAMMDNLKASPDEWRLRSARKRARVGAESRAGGHEHWPREPVEHQPWRSDRPLDW